MTNSLPAKFMPTGTLFVVATPIGNLQDISFRAIDTLKNADLIAAEDTRVAKRLLSHYRINTPIVSYHEHNEKSRTVQFLRQLQRGQSIALISDAGTPLINDPGYPLVHSARSHDIPIIPIPGPCAAIAALCAAGLPTDRFSYEGFLPKKSVERKKILATLLNTPNTIIFYESPHRIQAAIEDLKEVMGNERAIVLAKELTKRHEQLITGQPADILQWMTQHPDRIRGEFVIVLQGAVKKQAHDETESAQRLMDLLSPHVSAKTAATIGAEYTGLNKNRLYRMIIDKK